MVESEDTHIATLERVVEVMRERKRQGGAMDRIAICDAVGVDNKKLDYCIRKAIDGLNPELAEEYYELLGKKRKQFSKRSDAEETPAVVEEATYTVGEVFANISTWLTYLPDAESQRRCLVAQAVLLDIDLAGGPIHGSRSNAAASAVTPSFAVASDGRNGPGPN